MCQCLLPERIIVTLEGRNPTCFCWKFLSESPQSVLEWEANKHCWVTGFSFVKYCSSAPPPVYTAALIQKTLALGSIATFIAGRPERKQIPCSFQAWRLWSGCRVTSVCFASKFSYYQLKSWKKSWHGLPSLLVAQLRDFSVSEKGSYSGVPQMMYIALQNGWRQRYHFTSLPLQSALKCFIWRSMIDVSWAEIRENRVKSAGLVPLAF